MKDTNWAWFVLNIQSPLRKHLERVYLPTITYLLDNEKNHPSVIQTPLWGKAQIIAMRDLGSDLQEYR